MKKIFVLIVSVLLALGTFPVVRSPGVASAATDLETKVAALPKNDTQHLYILNSRDDTRLTLNFADFMARLGNVSSVLKQDIFVLLHWDLELLKQKGLFDPYGNTDKNGFCVNGTAHAYDEFWLGPLFFGTDSSDLYTAIKNSQGYQVSAFQLYNLTKMSCFANESFENITFSSNLEFCYPYFLTGGKKSYQAGENYPSTDGYAVFGLRIPDLTETPYIYIHNQKTYYSLTFEYLDGSGAWTSSTQLYAAGTAVADIVVPTLPSAPYATFASWNKALSEVSTDRVYTALYNYDQFTVTFYRRDGMISKVERATYYRDFSDFSYALGDYSAVEGNYRKTYRHVGWSAEKDNPYTKIEFSAFKVSTNVSLYPLYVLVDTVDLDTGQTVGGNWLTNLWNTDWDILGAKIPIGKIVIIVVAVLLIPVFMWLVPFVINFVKMIVNAIKRLFDGARRKIK